MPSHSQQKNHVDVEDLGVLATATTRTNLLEKKEKLENKEIIYLLIAWVDTIKRILFIKTRC